MLIFFIKRDKSLTDVLFIIIIIMHRYDYITLLRITEDKKVCILNDDRLKRVV